MHDKILKSRFAETVRESEMMALVLAVRFLREQQAEIEKLMERIAEVSKTIKSEAIKEFAKRLKEKSYKTIRNYGLTKDVVEVCDIDNLVKEMVGGEE